MGWAPTGIDPVPAVANYGREQHGLDIRCGTFEQADLPPNTFDVVFSNAVLEHIASPTAFLTKAHRVLRPGGIVFADTVNIQSLTWRWIGPEWKLVDPRAHLSMFSPETLRGFYQKSGFRVVAITTHGVRIRPNHAKRLAGLARWTEEAVKLPFRAAAWWTLQGDSIAAIGQKAA
jgi:2-polyprenyl-3-methyl-5-hydroxy-6-metoxy-1,4-benzoquinol methylase